MGCERKRESVWVWEKCSLAMAMDGWNRMNERV